MEIGYLLVRIPGRGTQGGAARHGCSRTPMGN